MRANTGAGVWADVAYRSAEIETTLKAKGLTSHIHRKGTGPAHRCRPRPDKIASRLLRRARHPERRQVPARCRFADITAPRRSVFTRSPAVSGITDRATTVRSGPIPTSRRCRPSPQGPASWQKCRRTPPAADRRLANQLADMIGRRCGTVPPMTDLTPACPLRNRKANRRPVDIRPNERAGLHPVLPRSRGPAPANPAQPPNRLCCGRGR